MHELPITQGILDVVLDHAHRAGGGRVTDVYVVAGELSGVVEECLEFYWNILGEGTSAAGARLHVRRIPFELECRGCTAVFAPGTEDFACPTCGSDAVGVASGDGVRVESIDVEETAADVAALPGTAQEPRP